MDEAMYKKLLASGGGDDDDDDEGKFANFEWRNFGRRSIWETQLLKSLCTDFKPSFTLSADDETPRVEELGDEDDDEEEDDEENPDAVDDAFIAVS